MSQKDFMEGLSIKKEVKINFYAYYVDSCKQIDKFFERWRLMCN
jgi:hypothetical protein